MYTSRPVPSRPGRRPTEGSAEAHDAGEEVRGARQPAAGRRGVELAEEVLVVLGVGGGRQQRAGEGVLQRLVSGSCGAAGPGGRGLALAA
jgi:hypothetical protein